MASVGTVDIRNRTTVFFSASQNVGSATRNLKFCSPVNRRALRPSQLWNASTIVDTTGYSPKTANSK